MTEEKTKILLCEDDVKLDIKLLLIINMIYASWI